MISYGVATFGLDEGKCPKWLFERMVKLSRKMIYLMIEEFGPEEVVKRLADPVWFQSLGTVLAFDWNSSGLTTILAAALKEAIRGEEKELGIFICGGKGKTSRKTPDEILSWSNILGFDLNKAKSLVYNSKMAAKVDSALIQDGFQIYHHTFIFSQKGSWAVIQQGMNTLNQTARRYHWYSDSLKFHSPLTGSKNLVLEPHVGVISKKRFKNVLNLTKKESEPTQKLSVELVNQGFYSLMKEIKILSRYSSQLNQMLKIGNEKKQLTLLNLENKEYNYHPVVNEDFFKNKYLTKILYKLTELKPIDYEELLSVFGVGPKTIRALTLIAEVIYGAKPSYEDPARYGFAFGGKDATPYPVDRKNYDEILTLMKKIKKDKLL
ncbi:MAG: DUF763 domain-containing protein [Minisyncoccia bacterium]